MTILVRKSAAETYDVLAGHARLEEALRVFGKVAVTDIETGEEFFVHRVDGQVFALQRPGQAAAETAAGQLIARVKRPRQQP